MGKGQGGEGEEIGGGIEGNGGPASQIFRPRTANGAAGIDRQQQAPELRLRAASCSEPRMEARDGLVCWLECRTHNTNNDSAHEEWPG